MRVMVLVKATKNSEAGILPGDPRAPEGFDTLFEAWLSLCRDVRWDADLVVVGTGAELPKWRDRAAAVGVADRIRFLGFRTDVPDILSALDG